jgi:hypothetical protein
MFIVFRQAAIDLPENTSRPGSLPPLLLNLLSVSYVHCSFNSCNEKLFSPFMPHIRGDFEVPNPKNEIENSLRDLAGFDQLLSDAVTSVNYWMYPGDTSDVVDGSSLLVFMASGAVDGMKNVESVARKLKAEELKR